MLHTAAARVGALDLGFVPGDGGLDTVGMVAAAAAGELDVLFLLGDDEIDMQALGGAFVVYIGTHGDAGAHRADVILPGAAYTEKSAHLREYRGPRADDGAGRVPARRCARGLGDPAGAFRRSWQSAAVRFAGGTARARSTPRIRISCASTQIEPGALDQVRALAAGAGQAERRAVPERRSTISI